MCVSGGGGGSGEGVCFNKQSTIIGLGLIFSDNLPAMEVDGLTFSKNESQPKSCFSLPSPDATVNLKAQKEK